MQRLRCGQIVAIEFYDHVEHSSKLSRFVVYGRLASVTRQALSVDSWDYANRKLKYDSTNETRFTIVRSAIIKITRLVPYKGPTRK